MGANSQWILWLGIFGSVASLIALTTVIPIIYLRFAYLISRKKFIVVGATGVGKSSLLRIMEGRLPPRVHIRTRGYQDIRNVNLNLGGSDNLYFQATIVRELGGEFTRNLGATLADMNPNGLILLLDGHSPIEEQGVLLDLGKALLHFYEKVPLERIALRSILIVINKFDLISDSTMSSVIGTIRRHYKTLFLLLDDKLPDVHVNLCCGSLTEAQFFSPIENGIRFLARGVQQ
jgi:energy-coupling factor transporter ATP-binding protein EcfA2